ncbi:2Fe-2S iron-sulfur cluster-binding protein [Streptomyces sp. PsTaAH-124]|uniref:2Fe-2S iron-sulfur cluster-binding protein n=1 Tax=Streptomyces sp. PsTaAH-124 TaxID=1157638 RepID=UPI00035C7BB3|nr:2Fe-2S iron-sulfur cluster-binding protein [Streptomyces sp. PsTaAH-124]
MTDDQHGQGTPHGGGRWDPLPQGDYDDGATAFVQLPEGGVDALLAADSPLAAPGHGYVPPQITVTAAPAEATDPAATGTWAVPGVPAPGAGWPDPNAVPRQDEGTGGDPGAGAPYAYRPDATQQWNFQEDHGHQEHPGHHQEAAARGAVPGHDVTGQWSIPVAGGDIPDESGEFTTSALIEQWGGTPPATLPGGAPAPWATEGAGQPWGRTAQEPAPPQPYESDDRPYGADRPYESDQPYEGGQAYGSDPSGHSYGAGLPAPAPEHPTTDHPGAASGHPGHPGHPAPTEAAVPEAPAEDPAEAPEATGPTRPAQPTGAGHPAEPAAGQLPEETPAEDGEGPVEAAEGATEPPASPVAAEDAPAASRAAQEPPTAPEDTPAPAAEPAPGPDTAPDATDPGQTGPAEATGTTEADADAAATTEAAPEAAEPEDGPGTDTPHPGTATAPDPQGPPPVPPQDEHPLASYVLRVNGVDRPVTDAWIGESLLYVLRERLGLAGAKDGCSQGECGACNVQVDGRLVASCLVPAVTTAGSEVRTVEGLAADGQPSDVQRALARCGAVQCGFCVPGMAMTVHDLLEGNPAPSEREARQALCGNLCRCSGYKGVLRAVEEVVAEREAQAAAEHAAAESAGADHRTARHPADGGGAPDTDEPRIPHQAGPGAGGVHPSAFDTPDTHGHPRPHPDPQGHGEAHAPHEPPHDTHDPHHPHDPYGQDGGQA